MAGALGPAGERHECNYPQGPGRRGADGLGQTPGGALPRCLQLQHGHECGVTEACLTPWPGDKHLEIQAGRRPLGQAQPCDPKDQAEQHLPAPQRIHSQPSSPPHAIGSHFSLGPGTLVTLQHLSSLLVGHTQCTAVPCPSVASWGPEGSARAAASRAHHTPDGFTSRDLSSHRPGGWMAAGLPPSEGWKEDLFDASSPGWGWLPDNLWSSPTHGWSTPQFLPSGSHGVLPVCLCLNVSFFRRAPVSLD